MAFLPINRLNRHINTFLQEVEILVFCFGSLVDMVFMLVYQI